MSSEMATPVLGKRKRTQISYAEPDINDFDDEAEEGIVEEELLTDDDTTYGSRKKLGSTKKAAKRVKLTTPRTKKERSQNPFPFLELPAELRDYVYELALTQEGGITMVSGTKAFRRIVCRGEISTNMNRYRYRGVYTGGKESLPAHENSLSPNLLAVNKQIHAEGVAWLYQQPLILQDTMALHTFVAAIGPANRQIVTDIVVEGWGGGRGTHKAMNVAALTSLADCTNLESFRLDCHLAWYRQPRDLARQLYRDGHYFFERFGTANGRKDAVVDVLQLSDGNFDGQSRWGGATSVPEMKEAKESFRAELRKLLGC